MAFTGFPPELFAFYAGLEADNSKAYWEANRATYESAVKAPMTELAAALEERIGFGETLSSVQGPALQQGQAAVSRTRVGLR